MKRTFIIIISVVLLALLGGIGWLAHKTNNFKEIFPKANVTVLRYSQLGKDKANLRIRLNFDNKYPLAYRFEGFRFRILMDSVQIANSTHTVPLDLKPYGKNEVIIPVTIHAGRIKREAREQTLTHTDSSHYQIELTFFAKDKWYMKDTVTYTREMEMPTFRFPKIEFVKLERGRIRLFKDTPADILLRITNYNVTPMTIENATYSLAIFDNVEVVDGRYNERVTIGPKSQKLVRVPIQIDVAKALGYGGHFLSKKKRNEIPLKINLQADIVSNNDLFDKTRLITTITGTPGDLNMKK